VRETREATERVWPGFPVVNVGVREAGQTKERFSLPPPDPAVEVNFVSGHSKIVGQLLFAQDWKGKPRPKEILTDELQLLSGLLHRSF
jgi:hypothetical protein